ncbi:MAG: glycosyltransferase family 2 protein [Desulfovibrio sp.]|nr:glycosyltransferase family 2 protein [Desulfovibrio sp.]
MNAPLVSVIMNCHNGAPELPDALRCLREQTFQDFEIIFLDNASTDGSGEIAKAFGPKLRYFRNEELASLGAARNLAIKEARGELIAFLDCDDLWKPEKLAAQVELFGKNSSLGLVCTDTEIRRGNKTTGTVFEISKPARGRAFAELMRDQWISMSSAMLSAKALDRIREKASAIHPLWFDESLNVCEEADVFYRIAHDWEIDYVDQPLTVWRVHGRNTTFRKFGQIAKETRSILEKHRRLYPGYDREYKDTVDVLTRRADFQEAAALWRDGEGGKARKLVKPLLKFSRKYRLFWLASFLPGALFLPIAEFYFSLPKSFRRS